MALHVRRRAQNLVFGADLLEVALQLLVLAGGLVLCRFQTGKLRFEILDMPFLAFPECPLTRSEPALVPMPETDYQLSSQVRPRCREAYEDYSRSPVLRFPTRLRGRQIIIV